MNRSMAVPPEATSSSEQGPNDLIVPSPPVPSGGEADTGRKYSEKRGDTGNNRDGMSGASKRGGSGLKGGTPQQRGTQIGRKKGCQGSSSSRDRDVNRGGSSSSSSTPHVVPKFRRVRPQ